MTACAWPYASWPQELMIVRPAHWLRISPSYWASRSVSIRDSCKGWCKPIWLAKCTWLWRTCTAACCQSKGGTFALCRPLRLAALYAMIWLSIESSHMLMLTGDKSQMMEKVSRGPPGCRLHSSSHSRRGSIGITRSMRYTLVPRSRASASSSVPGLHPRYAPEFSPYLATHNLHTGLY